MTKPKPKPRARRCQGCSRPTNAPAGQICPYDDEIYEKNTPCNCCTDCYRRCLEEI